MMESYQVELAKGVEKDLRNIPTRQVARISAVIYKLALNPRPAGSVKLVGYDIEYRIRVGDYRVIYQVHDSILIILVIEIGHRKDIYR